MVKLKGPMSSAEASGTLGQAATFSSWKGRAYARAKTVPTNPKSELQVSVRTMLGFLSQQWAAISAANKATWEESAALTEVAPYSAYLSTNLARWRQFHAPTKVYPATEGGLTPVTTAISFTGDKAHVHIFYNYSNAREGWGALIFHTPTAIALGDRTNLIMILPIAASAPTTGTYHTTVLGLHHFRLQNFTTSGKLGGQSINFTVTVT